MARNILLWRLANYRGRTSGQLNRFLTRWWSSSTWKSCLVMPHLQFQTSSIVERLTRAQEKSRHCKSSDTACRPIQAHRPRCLAPIIAGETAFAETAARSAYDLDIGINPEPRTLPILAGARMFAGQGY
jgi:hypothetical protein